MPHQGGGSAAQSSVPPNTVTAPATIVSEKSATESPSIASVLELYRTGKWDAAEQQYRSLIEAEPTSAGAYAGLARVYLKEKRMPDALAAVALSAGFADGHVALGEVYFRQGKLYEAEQEFIALVGDFLVDLDFPGGKMSLSQLPAIPGASVARH